MPDTLFSHLPDPCRPLADKFYREHRSPMRIASQGHVWVARQTQIIAALSLTPIEHGHWLTGLFVAPELRGQAIGRRLIEQALAELGGPVWLFCDPALEGYYQPQGFRQVTALPATLTERLKRYQRSKPLLAMERQSS